MKALQIISTAAKRRKAMALVMVITVVALMSILIVAIFSITRTEYKSTQAYVAAKSAKQIGDIGTAIVQAQIQNAQNTSTSPTARTTHATQPGMVRVYSANGDFSAAYKLYSSSQMKVTGDENNLYSDQHIAPSNWDTLNARYVDLNEPVVRPGLTTGTYAVYFPVLDPRAAWNYGSGGQSAGVNGDRGTTQVEGFSYVNKAGSVGSSGGGQDYSTQVVMPSDTSNPDNLRLPMPVEWLYILEDGTVGALDSSNKFISSGTSSATATNPIVGRVAFWADDESCKININTAAEPTFMSSPYYYHQRDAKWAHFPAVTGEYQRYPGHPATVALSAVLAPNYLLDPLLPSSDGFSGYMDVVNFKEQLYTLAPKITGGGSEAGTRPFVRDDLSDQNGERSAAGRIDLTGASSERLYASVDEMLFKDMDYDSSKGRSQASVSLPDGRNFFDHDTLERSRFFLTAQSRSPEFNIHGLPRVCMWPVADESKGPTYRTTFDNLIALCATVKKNASSSDTSTRSYFFRRSSARSGSIDLTISRNGKLLDYLVDQMSQHTWPATSYSSSGSNKNFSEKYGTDNVNQLAVQFFDYIRCTNLYDGIMARANDGWSVRNNGTAQLYTYGGDVSKYHTYTSPRITQPPNSVDVSGDSARNNPVTSQRGMIPGHGQVSPAVWSKGGRSYKGFGRMITISEIGFQFLCTADGAGGSLGTFPLAQPHGRGGGDAARYGVNPGEGQLTASAAYPNMNVGGGNAVWWSNFPPLSSNPTQAEINTYMSVYGCQAGGRSNASYHPSKHPGFNPANWNMTLPQGVWLQPNQKRIQVMLLLEAFCPSLGFTGLYPEFTIVLDGSTIGQMTLNGQRLFNTTGDIPIKSNNNIYDTANGAHVVGGHAAPSAIAGGRHTRQISNGGGLVLMPKDINYDTNNTSGHNALSNYAFCSDFVTVDRTGSLNVSFPGGDVKVQIYDTHNWESAQPVQTLYVNFGRLPGTLPVPNLPQSRPYSESIDSFGRINYTRTRQGPHYWVANFEGCVARLTGRVNPNYGAAGQGFWLTPPTPAAAVNPNDSQAGRDDQSIRGRLSTEASLTNETRNNVTANGLSVIAPDETDVVCSIVPAMGDYRTLAAFYNAPSSVWQPHPFSGSGAFHNHSFSGFWANTEPGCKLAQTSATGSYASSYSPAMQLIGGARFDIDARGNPINSLHSRQADLPPGQAYATAANAFGDFDTGISSAHEGPYINKPDEGNYYAGSENRGGSTKYWRSAYFYNTWQSSDDWRSGIFMTPNRLISSPVLFGSLPTGVWGNPGGLPTGASGLNYAPWQTLLFRPHANVTTQNPPSQRSHPGMQDPCDHYLLDLFFMPVVEPYAISEPLSIAGRLNMNYQIMPFTNIRRATGMHALMKGEYLTAIPNNHIVASKEYYPGQATWSERFWDDKNDNRYWHRPIDVAATLRQFDLKFAHKSGGSENFQGLFRSASQICEMHLVPRTVSGSGTFNPTGVALASSQSQINDIMNTFWSNNRPTGDNVRERPYSNLYARLTTRSNTFRVHVRAQVLKKARSTAADVFDPNKDAIVSEYRGSTLIERFIDPNDPTVTIPDYAASGINQDSLETFYRFRALETKRFNP